MPNKLKLNPLICLQVYDIKILEKCNRDRDRKLGSVRRARDWPHQDLETNLKSSLKEIFLKNSASH